MNNEKQANKNNETVPTVKPAIDPVVPQEEDRDELIHKKYTPVSEGEQRDPDEVVHESKKDVPLPGNETDIDDLMHK